MLREAKTFSARPYISYSRVIPARGFWRFERVRARLTLSSQQHFRGHIAWNGTPDGRFSTFKHFAWTWWYTLTVNNFPPLSPGRLLADMRKCLYALTVFGRRLAEAHATSDALADEQTVLGQTTAVCSNYSFLEVSVGQFLLQCLTLFLFSFHYSWVRRSINVSFFKNHSIS